MASPLKQDPSREGSFQVGESRSLSTGPQHAPHCCKVTCWERTVMGRHDDYDDDSVPNVVRRPPSMDDRRLINAVLCWAGKVPYVRILAQRLTRRQALSLPSTRPRYPRLQNNATSCDPTAENRTSTSSRRIETPMHGTRPSWLRADTPRVNRSWPAPSP